MLGESPLCAMHRWPARSVTEFTALEWTMYGGNLDMQLYSFLDMDLSGPYKLYKGHRILDISDMPFL